MPSTLKYMSERPVAVEGQVTMDAICKIASCETAGETSRKLMESECIYINARSLYFSMPLPDMSSVRCQQ